MEDVEFRRVQRVTRPVYAVPGGHSRFTKRAAYREAARVLIRQEAEKDRKYGDPSRFDGSDPDGYAYDHPEARAMRPPLISWHDGQPNAGGHHGELPDGDGGRAYYVLVRERLARWLMWKESL